MRIDDVTSSLTIQSKQINASVEMPKIKSQNNKQEFSQNSEGTKIEKRQINEDEIIKAIERANKSVKTYDRKLEFSIHDKTKQIMVKVIDTSGENEQIIREIPPEKVLDMVAKMWEMAGILIDEKV